jgi:hypothetical protein
MLTTNIGRRFGEPWGACQTCGRNWPASRLRLHRRFGWQCVDCYDGGPHPDEVLPRVAPAELVRKTTAPPVE